MLVLNIISYYVYCKNNFFLLTTENKNIIFVFTKRFLIDFEFYLFKYLFFEVYRQIFEMFCNTRPENSKTHHSQYTCYIDRKIGFYGSIGYVYI